MDSFYCGFIKNQTEIFKSNSPIQGSLKNSLEMNI